MKLASLGTAALFALALMACGGALTAKGEALDVRWYNPETAPPRLTSATPGSPERIDRTLELGRVTSGINLRERIAYRDAAYEVGFYDDKRWTERPEVYVRRALARTLFEERGMHRALAGQAPVLDVEVLSFEELRGAAPAARIQLRMLVHDDRDALVEKTLTVDRPVAPGAKGFQAFVQAMAQALDAAVEQVANEVVAVLATRTERQ
jgi:cholesterol transport system auxiliary component